MNDRDKRTKKRFRRMMRRDYTPVIETAMRECDVKSRKRAKQLLRAFLQWFSLIPEATEPLQMLQSVDRIWHAFVLNTQLYREFCDEFAGRFIDHDPADIANSPGLKVRYAAYALKHLKSAFGNELEPELTKLSQAVTCCIGCGSNPRLEHRKPGFNDVEYSEAMFAL